MKSKIRFYNLTPKMKGNLRDGAILSTAIAGGYGIFGIFGANLFSKDEIEKISELPPVQQEEIVNDSFQMSSDTGIEVETDLEVIESPADQSFAEAFSEARTELGPGGFFNYKGQTYSTFYDEEFSAKSADEQEAYAHDIDDQIDGDSVKEFDASTSLAENLEGDDSTTTIDDGLNGVESITDEDYEVAIGQTEGDGTNDLSEETSDLASTEITEEVDYVADFDVADELDLSIIDENSTSVEEIDFISSEDINTDATLEADSSVDGDASDVEISYDEFEDDSFGDVTAQAESSDEYGFATSEDITVSDFNDTAFEGAEVLESSDAASDVGFAIVEDTDFDDPLFDTGLTTQAESSNTEGSTGYAEVSLSDFNDPLFGDEPVQNTDDVVIVEVSTDLLTPAEGEDIITIEDEITDIVDEDIDVDIEVDLFDDIEESEDFLSSDIDELD